jgi:predicted nucleic acid-binding protein
MSDRFFLDTNIFVYAVDSASSNKGRQALELTRKGLQTRRGVVSYQVVQEFLNLALRRFSVPMKLADALEYVEFTFRPMLTAQSSYPLYDHALRLTANHSLSWYDSLIVAAAMQNECAVLYTEDLQHGQRFGNVRVQNPFI